MKIAIGYALQDGPYGGGNSIIRSFAELLPKAGHEVVWSLDDDDIDLIVLADPRSRSPNIPFAAGAILRYLAWRNPRALVVQQIHDCDERKNTRSMNLRQRVANYAADHTICVGSWMLDLDVVRPEHRQAFTAILNGARPGVFHRNGKAPWAGDEPLKLVTHHWGGHWMKGFDVYGLIDDLLDQPDWQDRIQFTYIGNVPAEFRFRNARHLPPLADDALAGELRTHHAYITASINEPAGLHHMEGALCGLPILYRRSGALPEYCDGFGIAFDGPNDVGAAIDRMRTEYMRWWAALDSYDQTDRKMVADYVTLFEDLLARRDRIVSARRVWRNPILFAINQIPI